MTHVSDINEELNNTTQCMGLKIVVKTWSVKHFRIFVQMSMKCET